MWYYESHTFVVFAFLTQEAWNRIPVAVDTGLFRSVLIAAVFSRQSASTKTQDTSDDSMEFVDVRLKAQGSRLKRHRSLPR